MIASIQKSRIDRLNEVIRKHYPIVTDAAIDFIEDSLMARIQSTRGGDETLVMAVATIRSLREEVRRFEKAWAEWNQAASARLLIELEVHRKAIEVMREDEETQPLSEEAADAMA